MTGWGEQKKKYGQLQHVDYPYLDRTEKHWIHPEELHPE